MKYNFVYTFVHNHMVIYGRQVFSVKGNITSELLLDLEKWIENHNKGVYAPVIVNWQKLEEE